MVFDDWLRWGQNTGKSSVKQSLNPNIGGFDQDFGGKPSFPVEENPSDEDYYNEQS